MKIYKLLNKYQTALLVPFVLSGLFFVLSELLNLLTGTIDGDFKTMLYNLSKLFYHLVPFVFCFFLTMVMSKGRRELKGFWSSVCLAIVFNLANNEDSSYTSLAVAIIFSLFCIFCFNSFEPFLAFLFTIIFSMLFGIVVGIFADYYENFVMWLAGLICNKGIISSVLYGISDAFMSLFNSDIFKNVFENKSFTGTMLINNEIVTGVKDLFKVGYNGELISTYLSGHYFTLFVLTGICVSLLGELKGIQRITLFVLLIVSLLSGNISLLVFFILLESPLLFLSIVLVNGLAFATAYLVNLEMGYMLNGSIIEMFMYLKNPVYLFAGGIVFVCIGYFASKLSVAKYGLSDYLNIYIPTRLNSLVNSLGGICNIVRFKDDEIEVRNPKLVDTIKLQCEIRENMIKSEDESILELKEYI